MPLILLRMFGILWLFGLGLFGASAVSSYLFSNEGEPDRTSRMQARLRVALLWPVALLSSSGRARLRNG